MADRTSARLFGTIFELLAENPTEDHKTLARKIFDETGDYDFNNYQMYVDDALIKLGLAIKGIDPEYPEEGESIIYADNKSFDILLKKTNETQDTR